MSAELVVTVLDVANAARVLADGGDHFTKFDRMTPTGAFRLRVLRPELGKAFETYKGAQLEQAEKFGVKNEAGTQYEFPDPDKLKAFNDAMAEIHAQKVTLAGCKPLTLADLGDTRVSDIAMTLLGPLVVE